MTDTEAAKVLVKMGEKGDFSFSDAEMIAIDKAIAMFTKQITKRPDYVICSEQGVIGACPDCHTEVKPIVEVGKDFRYLMRSCCPKCGRELYWTDAILEISSSKYFIGCKDERLFFEQPLKKGMDNKY